MSPDPRPSGVGTGGRRVADPGANVGHPDDNPLEFIIYPDEAKEHAHVS